MMSKEQISTVKKSWEIFLKIDPVAAGDIFYSKLFSTAPYLSPMFSHSRDEQSRKLIDMLSTVVERLERLDQLDEEIRQLGLRHKSYGVRSSDYHLVGKALLWTLQQGLGRDWSPMVQEAWEKCYDTLASIMSQCK